MDSYEITYSYQGPCPNAEAPVTTTTIDDGTTREYTVVGLEEFSDYLISVAAVNRAGRSDAASTTTRTLSTGCVCVCVCVCVCRESVCVCVGECVCVCVCRRVCV